MTISPEKSGRRSWGRRLTAAWITVTALLLLTPLAAMQFTDEVNWTVGDFAFAGGMLVTAGLIYELAARAGGLAYQAAVVMALGAVILIMWTTGAVGVIGSEDNPGNLLYLAVVGLAIVGAAIARGHASWMVWVMATAAAATVLVPVIAFAGVADPVSDVLAPEVFAATCVFAGMWIVSAWLFRKAARR
jgi:hypothetical protein